MAYDARSGHDREPEHTLDKRNETDEVVGGWIRHGPGRVLCSHGPLQVVQDTVTRPDGTPGTYTWARIAPSVRVLARLGDRVLLVAETVYLHRRVALQLPGGSVDPGETPYAAAMRELREETGYGAPADRWRSLGVVEAANAATDHLVHLLAVDEPVMTIPAAPEPTEDLRPELMPLRQAVAAVTTGQIREAGSVAAILLAAAT